MDAKTKALCMTLRSIAFTLISALEEFLEYEKERRTAHLLKQARRTG